jgi:hypothetical protein
MENKLFSFLLPCVSVLNVNNRVNILFIIQRTDHKNKNAKFRIAFINHETNNKIIKYACYEEIFILINVM